MESFAPQGLVRALLGRCFHRWRENLGIVAASTSLDHAHEGVAGCRCGFFASGPTR